MTLGLSQVDIFIFITVHIGSSCPVSSNSSPILFQGLENLSLFEVTLKYILVIKICFQILDKLILGLESFL